MITTTTDKKELLEVIDQVVFEVKQMSLSLDEEKINAIPYKDSWTAAQLLNHVTKSTRRMSQAMLEAAAPAERDPGEKIPFLKEVFLNFSKKLSSPDFIIPEQGPYKKENVISEFEQSFHSLRENAKNAEMDEIVKGLPFGTVTKLEILHFVLYHTQRHANQMKRITDALK